MLTDIQREAVIRETKTWIGTPYRGWSCLKGHGTDCGQLIYGIFRNCGLIPEITDLPRDYSLQVSQHQVSTEYVDLVARYFDEIPEAQVMPGDLVVYKLGHAYAHAAVVVSWPEYVIHAVGRHGVSAAHGSKAPTFRRVPRKFFTLKPEYCGGL